MRTIALIVAAILAFVSAGVFALAVLGVVVEWSELTEEVGLGSAAADALMRLAFGAVASGLMGSPVIVAWLRRERVQAGARGYVANACLGIAAAVAAAATALFATTEDAQAALVFLYPAIASPLCALGVAAALSRPPAPSSG